MLKNTERERHTSFCIINNKVKAPQTLNEFRFWHHLMLQMLILQLLFCSPFTLEVNLCLQPPLSITIIPILLLEYVNKAHLYSWNTHNRQKIIINVSSNKGGVSSVPCECQGSKKNNSKRNKITYICTLPPEINWESSEVSEVHGSQVSWSCWLIS